METEKEEEHNADGGEVKKNSGLTKLLSQKRRSATPDSYITKQATKYSNPWKIWIRKEPDADGYFLVQLWNYRPRDMFLTAEDASSLAIACK